MARSAALVAAGIILSRLFGLIRQRIVAHYFGVSIFADAITAAFQIGNLTQNLLGEGTLSASFIPVYAKLRAQGRGPEAKAFALSALGFLLLAIIAVSALGVAGAPWLTRVIAPGFDAERLESTVPMVRVLFPMTGLLVLSAWGLGVLNAHQRFFLSYTAPVLWSLAQIAGLVVFGEQVGLRGEALTMALAWSALVGAGLQLLVLLAAARSLLGDLRPRLDRSDPNLREAARRLPGVLLGRGVIQISGLIDAALVSFLGAGARAAFGYAQLIYLLPMSVLGTGEAAVSLPAMASDTADVDRERRDASLRARLGAALARVTTLTVPTTLALALLGGEIVRVLLQSGKFDQEATTRVSAVVATYAFALGGNASARVLTTTAHAIGDTRTPARYAFYRVVASTAGSLVLMRWFDVVGVVLGSVIAAWVEALALGWKLKQQIGGLGLEQIRVGRTAALGALCIAPALGVREILPEGFAGSFAGSLLVLGVFGGAFLVAAPALGLLDLRSLFRKRR
ncbi:murein biosynthesis integral membrane protein MurJ [Sorangium sp. So ce542]|uniref:murein biosynthesis integral membrane protein MurJ n=1 Tax=Sorangium sp. So ce542 TaxID=3133316 RepID=UPI003F5E1AE5